MQSTQNLLTIKGLTKHFPLPKTSFFKPRPILRAVENIHLQICKGETYGLVGESGCGKSTLGRTILQLYKPTDGEVVYHTDGGDIRLNALSAKQMRPYRRHLQMIFQDPYSSLNPRMTVGQIIAEGMMEHRFFKGDRAKVNAKVVQIMKDCGLQEYALHRYPHQFSGGQRQRICIARALAVKPQFIVCDECVSALDVSVQSQILNLLTDLKQKEGLTYLFISHDLSVVRHISDRIGVMYLGWIVEQGNAEEVFSSPHHPYTLSLISAIPKIKGRAEREIYLSGSLPSAVSPPSGCPFHTRCFMAQERCQRVPAPLVEVKKGHFVACHFAQMPTKQKRALAYQKQAKE